MPGKSLISSLTEKAQALAGTALGGKHPAGHDDASTAASSDHHAPSTVQNQPGYAPPAQEQAGTLSGRHYGLESIQHHLRSLQVQYSSGVSQENRQLQLLITATKGVALDYDAVGRDAKAQSKELFLWGQTQGPDIKDVSDRLAYLNFVHGALSYTLATDLDKSRTSWKNVRDAEAALAPRRAARQNLTNQMNKLRTEGGRTGGVDTKLQELEAQLKKADSDDAPLEKELELLKRTAIRESETLKWKALKEYGQKLALLATASEQLLRVLPSSPPEQYTGNQQTAAVRAALQNALDSGYAPKSEHLPLNVGQEVGETRSFGETHASELTTINTVTDNGHESAAPINPAALNNAPAPLPAATTAAKHYDAPNTAPSTHYAPPSMGPPSSAAHHPAGYSPPHTAPGGTTSSTSVPHAPTVAETGVPVTAGAEGPGPATGTLNPSATEEVRDRPGVGYGVGTHEQAPAYGAAAPDSATTHVSAEDEKRRLAAAEQAQTHAAGGGHQGGLVASTSTRRPPAHESAEDEKKRLEREERERVLQSNNSRGNTQDDTDPNGGAPPAYHD
ncbi:hypothetical protein CPB86DRAFT_754314 [Serendipita vermifera]|nr:hypothetical protein CPB86DRAFT_754314 [Serendipita vermifera]